MRRNGVDGKRRRVDPENGKARSGLSRISFHAAFHKRGDRFGRDAP
jgi:hypothetical protein